MASMLRHAGVVADRAAPSRAMAGVPKRAASVSIPRGGAGRVAERASVRWNPHPPWSRRSAGTASPSGRGDAVAARSTDGASSVGGVLRRISRASRAVHQARVLPLRRPEGDPRRGARQRFHPRVGARAQGRLARAERRVHERGMGGEARDGGTRPSPA